MRIGTFIAFWVTAIPGPRAVQAQAPQNTPVHIFGMVHRQRPIPPTQWFTNQEFQVMANHMGILNGPDGGGISFPGPFDEVLAINPDAVSLAQWEAMDVQPGDSARMEALDVVEDVFIHSADPASLTASVNGTQTTLWFIQDIRGAQIAPQYTPPGVTEYLVEWAPNATGPWTLLQTIPDQGFMFYNAVDSTVDASRFYRIRTRLLDDRVIDFSWTAQIDLTATISVAIASVTLGGDMTILCYGDAPTDPANARLEVDLNNNKVFEVSERFPLATVAAFGDGGTLFTGPTTNPLVAADLQSFRAVVTGDTQTVRGPVLGAYQTARLNNRINSRSHDPYLIWASHPLHIAQTLERLDAALVLGFAGMRFDFAFDTLELDWAASGVPPDWVVGTGDTRIADSVETFLATIKASRPEAILTINGRWAVNDPSNLFDRYMPHVDGADVEFFVIGNDADATSIQSNTATSLGAVWRLRSMGKLAFCLAGANRLNLEGRLKSFAFYLFVTDDNTYFYNELGDEFNQSVVYFPEWDVPLGQPIAPTTDFADLVDPANPNLLSRDFDSGRVIYNNGLAPQVVAPGRTMDLLSVEGGLSPLAGGDGLAVYESVTSVTIQPGDVAILVDGNSVPAASRFGFVVLFLLLCAAAAVLFRARNDAAATGPR